MFPWKIQHLSSWKELNRRFFYFYFFVKFVMSPGSCSAGQQISLRRQKCSWSVTDLGPSHLWQGASKQLLSSRPDWKGLLGLVRLWLSCMEYHFQPFWHATPAFDIPVDVKGQKSQPTQDHYFTAIKSLFNPQWSSFSHVTQKPWAPHLLTSVMKPIIRHRGGISHHILCYLA